MPYVLQGAGDYVYQLNVLLICYACIHFRAEDNYITQKDLNKENMTKKTSVVKEK